MHIHFVCTGNAYRSRLAEAYCKSKLQNSKTKVTSSGIAASQHRLGNGPICWYAMRLLEKNDLIPYMSWREKQTNKEILENVDLLICMRQIHLDFCQKELGYTNRPFEVWDIPDLNELDDFVPSDQPGVEGDINNIKLTEQTYKLLTKKVDNLIKKNHTLNLFDF